MVVKQVKLWYTKYYITKFQLFKNSLFIEIE